jgi:hypothetical protein
MRLLQDQQQTYQAKALQGLQTIAEQSGKFRQDCLDMKRLASNLEVTRVMGKMEGSHLTAAKDGVAELINDLDTFQTAITQGLKEIESVNHIIEATTQRMRHYASTRKT